MKKTLIFFFVTLFIIFFVNFNSVNATEDSDRRAQQMSEYYAKRYNYATYFPEETVYYRPSFFNRSYSFPERYKKVQIYQHQTPSGVPTIDEWQVKQITPWVDLVPGAEISTTTGTSTTYTTSWSATGGLELSLFKEILKLSGSVTRETTYGTSYFQEHSFVETYDYAVHVLEADPKFAVFTDYAIAFQQAIGKYKTFNYEGESCVWHYTTLHSAKDAIKEWSYTGVGYFVAPLEGIEYTKYTVIGATI